MHYETHFYLTAYSQLVANQKFNGDRLLALGPDLAASSFLLSRNCRVKFKERSGTEEEAEKVEGKWTRYDRLFVTLVDAEADVVTTASMSFEA